MTTLLAVKGQGVTALDSTPVLVPTSGEFGPGFLRSIDDWINTPAAGATIFSTYRLCRFPVDAKVKSVVVWTDTAPDTNAVQQLAFTVDVAFSDNTVDGTQVALQGQIPTTVGVGVGNPAGTAVVAMTTTPPKPGAYSTPNNIFGTITMSGNNKPLPRIDLMQGGSFEETGVTTSVGGTGGGGYTQAQISTVPLWQVFGYANNGLAISPGGFFDIMFTVKTVAATPAAYNLYCRVDYVL